MTNLRGHLYGTTLRRRTGKRVVLIDGEEVELVEYLMKMQNLVFPLTIGQLREKVGILTQARVILFIDDVLGPS